MLGYIKKYIIKNSSTKTTESRQFLLNLAENLVDINFEN